LLVAGLFWEKSTAGWWLISQTNRARGSIKLPKPVSSAQTVSKQVHKASCCWSLPPTQTWSFARSDLCSAPDLSHYPNTDMIICQVGSLVCTRLVTLSG
jgi:hypothetical protein